MNNGCVCCTVRGDLIRVVEGLMRRPGRFDGIIVETTGLADPVPVAQTFFMDDDVRAKTELDAVVALVDAKHLPLRLKDSREAEDQIAFADVVIVNKTDLVSPEEVARIEDIVRAINPSARIYKTTRSGVDLARVLDGAPSIWNVRSKTIRISSSTATRITHAVPIATTTTMIMGTITAMTTIITTMITRTTITTTMARPPRSMT